MAEGTYEGSRHLLSAHAYNSVWQLRVDAWSSIAGVTERLHDASLPQGKRAGLERELRELVDLVTPTENYWAFPGPQRVGRLRELLAAGEYELAGKTVDAPPLR